MDVLSWSRHFRNFPGQGELPVAGFTRRGAGGRLPRAALARGLQRRVPRRPRPPHRARRAPLPDLARFRDRRALGPGRPAAAAAGARTGWSSSSSRWTRRAGPTSRPSSSRLGFRQAGRHRSKAVELWRQGGVNLVLNAEPDSAAAAHFEHPRRRPSARPALRVDDAARAARPRGGAALLRPGGSGSGRGSAASPRVRAPDGTLALPRRARRRRSIWESDFHLLAGRRTAGALDGSGPRRPRPSGGQMDGFVLFHRAVFGLEPQRAGRPAGPARPGPAAGPWRTRRGACACR